MNIRKLVNVVLVFLAGLVFGAYLITASIDAVASPSTSPSIDDCPGVLPVNGFRPEWELYDKVISNAGRLRCVYDQIQYRATLTPSFTPSHSPTPTERWIPPEASGARGASIETPPAPSS